MEVTDFIKARFLLQADFGKKGVVMEAKAGEVVPWHA